MSTPPNEPESPSLELLRAAGDGDAAAVSAWFHTEHPRVYRLCFGFLAHAAEAEDVAQESMLRLLDHLSDLDPTRPYRPWRTGIVLNACRDRMRRARTRREAEEDAALARAERPMPDPRDELERAEAADLLALGLRSLPPREREAFVLRDLEALPTADVARALGIGESSVRSLVTLARQRLRQLLAARLAPGGNP